VLKRYPVVVLQYQFVDVSVSYSQAEFVSLVTDSQMLIVVQSDIDAVFVVDIHRRVPIVLDSHYHLHLVLSVDKHLQNDALEYVNWYTLML
jgi:hypothetical protein